jgi:hypothetical protein
MHRFHRFDSVKSSQHRQTAILKNLSLCKNNLNLKMALWRTDGILELQVDIIALEFHFIQMHKGRESDISGIVLHLRFLYA